MGTNLQDCRRLGGPRQQIDTTRLALAAVSNCRIPSSQSAYQVGVIT
jgi:hypothetical protein